MLFCTLSKWAQGGIRNALQVFLHITAWFAFSWTGSSSLWCPKVLKHRVNVWFRRGAFFLTLSCHTIRAGCWYQYCHLLIISGIALFNIEMTIIFSPNSYQLVCGFAFVAYKYWKRFTCHKGLLVSLKGTVVYYFLLWLWRFPKFEKNYTDVIIRVISVWLVFTMKRTKLQDPVPKSGYLCFIKFDPF